MVVITVASGSGSSVRLDDQVARAMEELWLLWHRMDDDADAFWCEPP